MLDKEAIFKILREQNYWFREPPPIGFIHRPRYLNDIDTLLDSKAILFVKGPRRAGKTVLLDLIIRKMIAAESCSKEQILYVNLEDYRFYSNYSMELLETILECYMEKILFLGERVSGAVSSERDIDHRSTTETDTIDDRIFFFIDEIQHIDGFEHFLRTKYDVNIPAIELNSLSLGPTLNCCPGNLEHS